MPLPAPITLRERAHGVPPGTLSVHSGDAMPAAGRAQCRLQARWQGAAARRRSFTCRVARLQGRFALSASQIGGTFVGVLTMAVKTALGQDGPNVPIELQWLLAMHCGVDPHQENQPLKGLPARNNNLEARKLSKEMDYRFEHVSILNKRGTTSS